MSGYRWEEWGVLLSGGTVALCASRDVAQTYPHGWPAVRTVLCTPVEKSGKATVDIGPWVPLRGRMSTRTKSSTKERT